MSLTSVTCSQCKSQLQLPPELSGKLVKCPVCKTTFFANKDEPAGPTGPPPLPTGFSAAPLEWKKDLDVRPARRDDSHDGDYDDRRGRRRYARSYDDDYEDSAEGTFRQKRRDVQNARNSVAAPAICLMILGGLHIIAGIIVVLGPTLDHRGISPQGHLYFLAIGMLVIFWGGFIILGGFMMKTMRSYGFAIAGSVMALLTHPCNILGIGLGIWSLGVLSKSETIRAFRWQAGKE